MKVLIVLLGICLTANAGIIEKTIDFGEGETLTLRMEEDGDVENDYDTDETEVPDDEKNDAHDNEDIIVPPDDEYNHEDHEDILAHDCATIRDFQADLEKNDQSDPVWRIVSNGREGKIKRKYPKGYRKVKNIAKYNHAYGIPVFGMAHFKDESMKRACYLIRFLFADNEGFRRMAYKKKMYAFGEKGGIMTAQAGNIGNAGMSCPCNLAVTFPIRQIYTAAHELAHWYIKYVFPDMVFHGYLKLPDFVDNPEWKWNSTVKDHVGGTGNPVTDFLWNSIQQDRLTRYNEDYERCEPKSNGKYPAGCEKTDAGCKKKDGVYKCSNTHHYFIYTGQDNFIGLASNAAKVEQRAKGFKTNPNLFNLLDQIWPCKNTYVSVCEDFAHGWTKGLNQKLIIGKSDPDDLSKMICDADLDVPEIDEVLPLASVPAGNAVFGTTTHYKTEKRNAYADAEDKCLQVLERGPAEKKGPKGLWITTNEAGEKVLNFNALRSSLGDSTERAWWLRKCCATTAQASEWAVASPGPDPWAINE